MKHLLLILTVLVIGYVLWQVSDPEERSKASKFITGHGLRLGGLILLVLLLAATYLSSI
jgi:hypothetical protein